jgi:hypothetical protein
MKSFRDQHLELQYLIQDCRTLRLFNNAQAAAGTNKNCMLFAEAAVLCVALERFLRIIPVMLATDSDTIYNLLDRALTKNNPIFKPIHTDHNNLVRVINDIRNGIMHGNFEKLAKFYIDKKLIQNTDDYFYKAYFTQDIQIIYDAFILLIQQVDINNGSIK